MPFKYYMLDEVLVHYYEQIKAPKSIATAFDLFWANLLPLYFTTALKFEIEQPQLVYPGNPEKPFDLTVAFIRNGDLRKAVVLADKLNEMESSSFTWPVALHRLTDYLDWCRTYTGGVQITMYGAVNIGTYIRFYQLDPDARKCIDLPLTQGAVYELATDEEQIHNVLTWLVQKTLP